MGRRSQGLIKKLEKKVIKRLGQDITYRRRLASNDTEELDRYGEPIDTNSVDYDERTIRAVIICVELDEQLTTIGGLADSKKEKLKCYISQSEDIQIGDQLFYPANSSICYEITKIEPNVFQDDVVIWKVEAHRDPTTK